MLFGEPPADKCAQRYQDDCNDQPNICLQRLHLPAKSQGPKKNRYSHERRCTSSCSILLTIVYGVHNEARADGKVAPVLSGGGSFANERVSVAP